ncbi:hypothetical protein AVEN_128188-1 [Araneus ventricosus]|uniref:Uncharacterized protein n=1 Tax=Araneus ventricosus TaxID=182803 RepID=A0A4Y1ZZW3_ARAVE|nr:hypothetical protein AVEN_128188-1 [Araneus ventricosus]
MRARRSNGRTLTLGQQRYSIETPFHPRSAVCVDMIKSVRLKSPPAGVVSKIEEKRVAFQKACLSPDLGSKLQRSSQNSLRVTSKVGRSSSNQIKLNQPGL